MKDLVKQAYATVWGNDPKMINHCAKSTHVIVNGKVVEVANYSHVQSTLYYDDETTPPANRFDCFMAANRYEFRNSLETKTFEKPIIFKKYGRGEVYGVTYEIYGYEWKTEKLTDKIYLTESEIETINQAIKDHNEQFTKRLNTWWKKYSDKFSNHGYWANR